MTDLEIQQLPYLPALPRVLILLLHSRLTRAAQAMFLWPRVTFA